jgi:hypothetical protein
MIPACSYRQPPESYPKVKYSPEVPEKQKIQVKSMEERHKDIAKKNPFNILTVI